MIVGRRFLSGYGFDQSLKSPPIDSPCKPRVSQAFGGLGGRPHRGVHVPQNAKHHYLPLSSSIRELSSGNPSPSSKVRTEPKVEIEPSFWARPIAMSVAVERKPSQIGVDHLGAHEGNRADGGVAIHGSGENLRNPKISYLHHTLRTDKQIGGFDITMNNLTTVEIIEARENLAGEIN
nr:hypothetical protein EUGRSUZ_J03146 [Ipomoea batatas]GMC86015.1 hypothetical protein EUGRSUZ_J03146 [Ipomoea batatas]